MITIKSQFVQHVLTALTLAFVLGVLSIIWPAIIAVFLGILLLLQSLNAEPEVVVRFWAEVEHVLIAIDALRSPNLLAVLS